LRQWSEERVVDEVIKRHERGQSLRGDIVSAEDRGLYQAAKRYFGKGGWAKARVLAGFSPVDPKPGQKWNPTSVVREIQRLHQEGVPLNTGSLQGEYGYILAAGRKVFGSWAEAIRQAGLDYEDIRKIKMRWWTKARVITCVKNLDARGVRLSSKSIHLSHGDLFAAAIVHFTTWGEAVERAGISYAKHCRIFSSKAWLRRLSANDRQVVLDRASKLAKRGEK
jgi:hypothetical protein